ncbi:MAG TPA: pilus assembly PilX N-terminal domain-containing protein [Candidatus Aquicultoraceae bacterium]|nr:pilus assembly PilX N-terminal domain-containing protein [Candidatus Aquicultoraceae bacterium]
MNRGTGSALVITLMLLMILTAIGIYAVDVTTTELDVALQSRVGTATLNAAEGGVHFAIDRVPDLIPAWEDSPILANRTSYVVRSWATGVLTIRPGYGSNYRFAEFAVQSEGRAAARFAARRTVEAVVRYGPVPAGTMY